MSRSDHLFYPPNMHPPMLPPPNYRYAGAWQHSRPGEGPHWNASGSGGSSNNNNSSSNVPSRERSSSMLSDTLAVATAGAYQQSPNGAGPHRGRLTTSYRAHNRDRDETRRRNHIMSEQKRRYDINDHLQTLRKIIPEGEEGDSKAVTLAKTIRHVQHLHRLLDHWKLNPQDLSGAMDQMPKMTTLSAPSPSLVQEADSEPLTPSSVSSIAGHSFFSEHNVSFQRSSSETEESDVEPQPKRRLSVRDLCI